MMLVISEAVTEENSLLLYVCRLVYCLLLLLSGSGKPAEFLVSIANAVLMVAVHGWRSVTPLITHHCDIVNMPFSHVYNK